VLALTLKYKGKNQCIAAIAGDLNKTDIHSIKEHTIELITTNDALAIDLAGIKKCDTVGFQFLAALKKHAAVHSKRLKFLNHSEAIIDKIDLYGVAGVFRDKIILTHEQRARYRFAYGTEAAKFK